MMHQYLQVENQLSLAMLEEATTNKTIKQVLKDISIRLIDKVLTPINSELKKVDDLAKLPGKWPELIKSLAAEHTAEKRQFGALYPLKASSQEITDSLPKLHQFLDDLTNTLLHVDKVTTVDDIAVIIKILIELGYSYYENPLLHSAEFKRINIAIGTTVEELDIRLFRTELKQPEQLALTFGINTTKNDLGLNSLNKGRNAGKAVFGVVSMKARLSLLCELYDNKPSDYLTEKMRYYKIPLEKGERKSIDIYAKKWQPWFEKLATDPIQKMTFPLIASVSRSTTRLLVSLHDIKAFNDTQGVFDFDKLQIFTNCIMGYLVHSGHHSMIEVAEVYNRVCDLVAIDLLESTSKKKISEENLPYYRIGAYATLFHPQYREKVMETKPKVHSTRYGFSTS